MLKDMEMDCEDLDFLEPDFEDGEPNTVANKSGELNDRGKMLPPPVQNFRSREELLEYVRRFSFIQGYATSITDSKKDKYVTIGCDRGGTYRNRLNLTVDDRKRKTCSRLIDCPFKLKGVHLGDTWVLQTKNGAHNHQASTEMSGHPSHRRFRGTEFVKVKEMAKSGILPRQMLASLRQDNPDLQATSKTVSNAKAKIRKEMLGGRTPIQALLEELEIGGFKYEYKIDADKRLTHLFFAHPSSIKLSKSYSNVFVMDCTYKTNRFGMPLLDVIGVSSFNTSFYSCFAFLSQEGVSDYSWALNAFKNMLGSNEPAVIVSDRELALMNAIRVVFPMTTNLLCCWHIEKNIFANCRKRFKEENDWDIFLSEWTDIIESDSEFAFNEGWKALECSYKEKVDVINYLKRTWLPYKQYFVKAWTDTHLHFGNRVTSRAEGAHAALKGYLQVSTGNLQVASEKICLAVENNFHEIKTRLGSEKMRVPHTIQAPLLKDLVCRVSLYALELLFKQYKKALSDSPLPTCTGYFVGTMGLPCAHVMRRKMNGVLSVSDVHSQWRIDLRSFDESWNGSNNDNDKLKVLLQELENEYQEWPIARKEAAHDRLSQLINPLMPVVFEPRVLPRKGRPSRIKSKRASNSTRRDKSAFEIAGKTRHCSNCGEVDHNCRTCSAPAADTSSQLYLVERNPLGSLDLNSLPSNSAGYLWD